MADVVLDKERYQRLRNWLKQRNPRMTEAEINGAIYELQRQLSDVGPSQQAIGHQSPFQRKPMQPVVPYAEPIRNARANLYPTEFPFGNDTPPAPAEQFDWGMSFGGAEGQVAPKSPLRMAPPSLPPGPPMVPPGPPRQAGLPPRGVGPDGQLYSGASPIPIPPVPTPQYAPTNLPYEAKMQNFREANRGGVMPPAGPQGMNPMAAERENMLASWSAREMPGSRPPDPWSTPALNNLAKTYNQDQRAAYQQRLDVRNDNLAKIARGQSLLASGGDWKTNAQLQGQRKDMVPDYGTSAKAASKRASLVQAGQAKWARRRAQAAAAAAAQKQQMDYMLKMAAIQAAMGAGR